MVVLFGLTKLLSRCRCDINASTRQRQWWCNLDKMQLRQDTNSIDYKNTWEISKTPTRGRRVHERANKNKMYKQELSRKKSLEHRCRVCEVGKAEMAS